MPENSHVYLCPATTLDTTNIATTIQSAENSKLIYTNFSKDLRSTNRERAEIKKSKVESFLETALEARLKIPGNILRVQHLVAKQPSIPAATLAVFRTYYHFSMPF